MGGEGAVTNKVDQTLAFIQQHFNVSNSGTIADANKLLDMIIRQQVEWANSPSEVYRRTKSDLYRAKAIKLKEGLKKNIIISDPNKYNKFNKLGNFGLGGKGLVEVYTASNEIIKDINKARLWIDEYKAFAKVWAKVGGDMHTQLVTLGQSILGRAIELTPYKTGFLRSSGALYDFGTYIVIAFTAPYASYVHENLEISHPVHPSNPNCGGRAKFLEIAVQEAFPNRNVWTEVHGYQGVMVQIGLNPEYVKYSHYN